MSFKPRHHPSAVERGEHGARNVCALKTARGEFVIRQAREILVGERHGSRLLDAGQERGEAGRQETVAIKADSASMVMLFSAATPQFAM
jgi:hypothetical protein